jgi:predicted MFS family arabinose efflux permease
VADRGERFIPLIFLAALVAAHMVGLVGNYVSPLMVGALMDGLGFDEAGAGALASAEYFSLALAALTAANIVARHSRARLALAGAALAFGCHLVAAFTASYAVIFATRVLAGLGEGVVLAAGNAAAAGTRDPDRVFASITIAGGLGGAALLTGLPFVTVPYGTVGAFFALAVLTLLVGPLLSWLPPPGTAEPTQPRASVSNRALGMLGLLAFGLLASGQSAVWAFAERLALGAGLTIEGAGQVLGATSLIGLAGAGLAAWLGTRAGRVFPVIVGVLGQIVSAVILINAPTPVVFAVAALIWGGSFFFSVPYLMGTMATLDARGQWTAAAAGAEAIGASFGPVIAGFLVTGAAYRFLVYPVVVTGLIALALIFPVVKFANSRSRLESNSNEQ